MLTNQKQLISDYLVSNRSELLELCEPWTRHKERILGDSNPVFHDDIRKQYRNIIQHVIAYEIGKDHGLDPMSILEELETVEWSKYGL